MITIFQADKNYKENPNYIFFKKNIENLELLGNNYHFHLDNDNWISFSDLKIFKLLNIIKNYDDNEIIMSIDGLDTLVVADDNEIEKKFLDLDIDILYSSEKVCWPEKNLSNFFTDNCFLNAGTVIFKNKKFQIILEILSELINNSCKYNDIDQYFHAIFTIISLQDIKIKLDKSNSIFQCLINENENNFEKINNRLKNINTNSFPCVFHGNGVGGKEILKKFFNYENRISFLGFSNNKMGINIMNTNCIFDSIKIQVEIRNIFHEIIYSKYLELPYNTNINITAEKPDNYLFIIYDTNCNILLHEKNFPDFHFI